MNTSVLKVGKISSFHSDHICYLSGFPKLGRLVNMIVLMTVGKAPFSESCSFEKEHFSDHKNCTCLQNGARQPQQKGHTLHWVGVPAATGKGKGKWPPVCGGSRRGSSLQSLLNDPFDHLVTADGKAGIIVTE